MKKISFDVQCLVILLLLGIAHLAAYFTQMTFFVNIAWILGGFMFLLNPVWPSAWGQASSVRKKWEARIAGVLIIIIGFGLRSGI